MNSNTLILRDKLFDTLTKEIASERIVVRPRSPLKYNRNECESIVIEIPELHPRRKIVCGMGIQVKHGPYKLWFETHPEWELITKYPVTQWAMNRPGIGSGNGFYLNTQEELIEEIKAYLMQYYAEYLTE